MLTRVLIALVIIAGLAVGGFFFKDYLDQSAKADDLEAQLQKTNNSAVVLSKQAQSIQTEIADLVKRSNEAQAAIVQEKESLPVRIDSNTIVRSILVLGQTVNVTAIPLSTQDWATVKVGSHDYSVFRMSIEANGSPENIVEFLRNLQENLYPTLVIESVNLIKAVETEQIDSVPTPVVTETPIAGLKADLKLAIYAR